MALRERAMGVWKALTQGENSIPFVPAGYTWEIPPGWTYEGYLRAYGQIGWLFGCVSRIGQGVAEVPWRLYKTQAGKERVEIDNHVLLDMMAYVNPFQTWGEFIECFQMYIDLVGEAFIILVRNRLGVPAEMWLAPPQRMYVIPDRETFIKGYLYKHMGEIIPLEISDVIHVKMPNPLDPYRGLGPVQAIAVDLEGERYAGEWNRNFFFNSAEPGGVIEAPDGLTDVQYERLKRQFEERHRGTSKAHRVALLERAKYSRISLSQRDMDFWRLRQMNRNVILGAYGVHPHIMGISESVNRANAEAADYGFALRVVRPRLVRIRGKLNEQLCPMYDAKLELDFDNPVPEDRELVLKEVDTGVRGGWITINEARIAQGQDPLPPARGDVLLQPINIVAVPIKGTSRPETPREGPKTHITAGVKLVWDDEQKEEYWRRYAAWTEQYEDKFVSTLRSLWAGQEEQVLDNLLTLGSAETPAFNLTAEVERFQETMLPLLTAVVQEAVDQGFDLIAPEPAHRASLRANAKVGERQPLSGDALIWLMDHAATLVTRINETTLLDIRMALVDGFAEGEGVPELSTRIRSVFRDASRRRAILIARTEVIAASAEGALIGYDASGVVGKAEFYASLDARLCVVCMGYHGTIYSLTEARGIIPVHPDCRCTWLPIES